MNNKSSGLAGGLLDETIRLKQQGYTNIQIAKILDIKETSVRYLINYNNENNINEKVEL